VVRSENWLAIKELSRGVHRPIIDVKNAKNAKITRVIATPSIDLKQHRYFLEYCRLRMRDIGSLALIIFFLCPSISKPLLAVSRKQTYLNFTCKMARVIRFPRHDDETGFVLVSVISTSGAASRSLDLKLVGTEGSAPYAFNCKCAY
jgi:hypothetical protein